MLLNNFRKKFPNYIFFCPFRKKEIISTPLKSIKEVFIPKTSLCSLINNRKKDKLLGIAYNLILMLSNESGISLENYGLQGSIALNMYTSQSDIDLVIYGSNNFRRLEETIEKFAKKKVINYVFTNRLDMNRRSKGRYLTKLFMYNAVRKFEEVYSNYGGYKYKPIFPVKFYCSIKDDREGFFQPAIYKIKNYKPIGSSSKLNKDKIPKLVVSMISCYRNIAKKEDRIEVSGTLEQVKDLKTDEEYYQVVVGTSTHKDEYIRPVKTF
jgi:predicted nucleotidyltransferase